MLKIKTPDGTEVGVDLKTVVKDSMATLINVHADIKQHRFINSVTRLGVEDTLSKIINYLSDDRVTEGIGAGGWSKTASKYVELIYGHEAASLIHESMTDTALVVEAVKAFESFINLSKKSCEIELTDAPLKHYIEERWNFKSGDAGVWKPDREGGGFEGNHLRHTAMIARIFGSIPDLRRNLGKTAEWVRSKVIQMDSHDWKKEKIATPVAVYVSIKYFEKYGKYLSSEAIDRIRQVTIDEAISRYDSRLKGWHSGPFKEVALPFYTLFLLAEMPEMWLSDTVLKEQMEESLKPLLGSIIHSPHGYGLSVYGKGHPDIGLSSLMISALLQKPSRNKKEEDCLLKLIKFVVESVNSGNPEYWEDTYAWTASYFVRDLCMVLTNND